MPFTTFCNYGIMMWNIFEITGLLDSQQGGTTMKCPHCGYNESKVTDSRPQDDNSTIRRRRECLSCQKRFTTFEIIETVQIIVIKKNGDKELFDKQKLLGGVLKATQKRPVDAVTLVSEVESELQNTLRQEVSSTELGEIVMAKLKERDEVAYVRFASVYREFKDIDTFLEELQVLKERSKEEK